MATQKTTKKKAAKKTYTSAKKTNVPKLKKKSTVEELAAVMAENHAKTEAIIAETSAEVKALAVEVRILAEESKETRKVLEETLRTVESTSKTVESTSTNVDRLSDNFGGMGNKLGSIVEFVVIPHIRQSINAAGGHSFTNIVPDITIRDIINDVKKDVAQMDVFLYNDTDAMAVEIKTSLTVHDVNNHVIRLEKLRKHEENPNINLVSKKLFGAVVGIIIDSRAKTLALEKGLYVVQIQEDDELLDITKPEECKTW